MPSKKKSRLLFEVPVETEPGAQSGWVYKSDLPLPETPLRETPVPETPLRETDRPKPGAIPADHPGVLSMSAAMVAHSIAAIAHAFALSVAVATIPWTMTLRTLGALTQPGDEIK